MNSDEVFEIIFLLFLFGNFVLKYYLDRRQVRSIQINRGAVPAAFAGKITLEAHQKAADYSVERIKFGQLARITDLGFVLIATIGGLIQFRMARRRHLGADRHYSLLRLPFLFNRPALLLVFDIQD